jgi:hypothetical protein
MGHHFKGPYARVPLSAGWARRTRFHPMTTRAVPIDLRPGTDMRSMTPEGFLAYFERLSVENPAFDEAVDGAECLDGSVALSDMLHRDVSSSFYRRVLGAVVMSDRRDGAELPAMA